MTDAMLGACWSGRTSAATARPALRMQVALRWIAAVLVAAQAQDLQVEFDRRPENGVSHHCTLPVAGPAASASLIQSRHQRAAPASEAEAGAMSLQEQPTARLQLQQQRHGLVGSSSSGQRQGHVDAAAGAADQSHSQKVLPAGWFGGFDEAESTFDIDNVGDSPDYPEREASKVELSGHSVNLDAFARPEYYGRDGLPQHWFEESKSAGAHAAWQTKFPPVEVFRAQDARAFPWLVEGRERKPEDAFGGMSRASSVAASLSDTMKKDAVWFDESVKQYDFFGRNTPPTSRDDRYYWDWQRKTWSTTFGCKKPGCIANATLKTMDVQKMQHAKCTVSIAVHATDYDDEYSREYVEWLMVNGETVNTHCNPQARNCNSTAKKDIKDLPTYPCVTEFPADYFLTAKLGTLKIAGKISPMVDECPVKDNLLSGVVTVSCLVKPWPKPVKASEAVMAAKVGKDKGNVTQCHTNGTTMQCAEHGCIANVTYNLCRLPEKNEKCTLSVKIWQTDFDNDVGAVEVVEYVQVAGKNISTNLMKKGRNPCKEVLEGKAKPANPANLTENYSKMLTNHTEEQNDSMYEQLKGLYSSLPVEQNEPDWDTSSAPGAECRRRGVKEAQKYFSISEEYDSALREPESAEERYEKEVNAVREDFMDYDHLRAAPDKMVSLVSGKDVTKAFHDHGTALISAKISPMVDECGKDGYLLNTFVMVDCKKR